jgi:flagellar biosynthesis protein
MRSNTHKRKHAVALRYQPQTYAAPQVVASGAGLVAERLLQLAQENNVPIHQDGDLVTLLAQLDIGAIIPAELYSAVAEVLAFVHRVKILAENKQREGTR